MRIAIYARVSDDKKKQDGERRQDVQRQIEYLTPIINARHPEDKEIALYVDDGKSAFTDDFNQRPAFKQLLNDARRHFIQEIWVEDMTRLSRNLSMGLQWLKELGGLQVHLISVKEGEIEVTSVKGWMQSSMLLMFAELDSRMKSEKVKNGMQAKKNLGKHIGRPKKRGGLNSSIVIEDGDDALGG